MELIFINDASPDHTIDKLLEYEKEFPNHILIINSVENLKQGGARNLGLQYASGEYIGFVDADDWIEPTMFEKLYQKAVTYDCDVVSCSFKRVSKPGEPMGPTGKKDRYYIIEDPLTRKDLILTGTGSGLGTKIYRRSMLIDHDIYFPVHLSYEDNFFAAMVIMHLKKFYFLEEYLYHYYINPNSTVMTQESNHHFDRLTVELMKLEEYKKRGLFKSYYYEIEYNFLLLYYLNTLHIAFTRFYMVPAPIFAQMQKVVIESFPDFDSNPYINKLLSNTYKILLKTIRAQMNQDSWQILAELYRLNC